MQHPSRPTSAWVQRGPHIQRTVPFAAGDALPLHLVNIRGAVAPTRGPVLLVHGAGVRGEIFRPPTTTTLVDALVAAGWDVWLENWRASIDVPANDWDLDQAAVHDHPPAVATVLAATGAERLPAIIHCQGSTSFAMSAVAGLVPEVDTILSNAVSLHPVVPRWSRLKAQVALPLVARGLRALDPSWGDSPPPGLPRLLARLVEAVHHECHDPVCHLVSFTYGSGFPALWRHENLNGATHDRFIPREFGRVPLTFFRHIGRCIRAGHLVSQSAPGLPENFASGPPQTDARFVLFAGARNRCFLPESQERTFAHLDRIRPGHHKLFVLPRYSHLDVFLGEHAHRDVFPLMLDELAARA